MPPRESVLTGAALPGTVAAPPPPSRLRTGMMLGLLLMTLALLYYVRAVLPPFIIAFLLLYLLNPVVERLVTVQVGGRLVPRVAAVILVMSVLLGTLVATLSFLVPSLVREFGPFKQNLPLYFHQVVDTHLPNVLHWLQNTANQVGLDIDVQQSLTETVNDVFSSENGMSLVGELQKFVGGVFSALFRVILIFILTLFLLLDWPRIRTSIAELVPERHRGTLGELVSALDRDLSGSIRGQLLICLINFVLTTIGLWILQVKYGLTLGVIAGAFSIVPVFGSIVSTIPIVLVSLTVSIWDAVKAVLMVIFIHLIEANILNPKIMGHHVELHPVIILFAIMVGEHVFGPIGLLVGVPVAAALRSILRFGWQQLMNNEAQNS